MESKTTEHPVNENISLEVTIYTEPRKIGMIDKRKHAVLTSVKASNRNEVGYYKFEISKGSLSNELYYNEKLTTEQIKEMVDYYNKNPQYIKTKL